MSNPIFNALSGNMNGSNTANLVQQVQRFRQEMSGKNPNEEIQKLLQSGTITQDQLNQAQQMAYQLQGLFRNTK